MSYSFSTWFEAMTVYSTYLERRHPRRATQCKRKLKLSQLAHDIMGLLDSHARQRTAGPSKLRFNSITSLETEILHSQDIGPYQ